MVPVAVVEIVPVRVVEMVPVFVVEMVPALGNTLNDRLRINNAEQGMYLQLFITFSWSNQSGGSGRFNYQLVKIR